MNTLEKKFPAGMVPLGDSTFQFSCHAGVSCFTVCCRNVDLILYPYDIICLKRALGIDSEECLRSYTLVEKGDNPFFPSVKLRLTDDSHKACPFLQSSGCSVYTDRPSACRTYPLERAVDRSKNMRPVDEYYFLTNHSYCLGHQEDCSWTVSRWVRNQRLNEYNVMNELWAEMESVFRLDPWRGEGPAGEKQQLAFMVCYNIDGFRRFVAANKLLQQFSLDKDFKKRIAKDDAELLKFGLQWLKLVLTGKSSLLRR